MSDHTTCRCGASWTGPSRAHCSGCHQTFNSVTLFDRHRKRGSCLSVEALALENVSGVWMDRSRTLDRSVFAPERKLSDDDD